MCNRIVTTAIFIITYGLNIFDLLCTDYLINKFGLDIETNIIGRFLYNVNLISEVKIFIIGGFITLLYYYSLVEHNTLAKIGLIICLICYISLAIFHSVLLIKIKGII